ncbi:MAG: lysophospholipid acyltransferase family protein [Pseudotabrizicola sp.]|nr:lysophospholipid acyltransferase family protein [Pseudotabrizicola sp.]MDO8884942.1 lysophospholipid acyltransferase family protein [Pseudotabrizicola sp.]MDP2081369.1 lysophospholipid acyltransferase family protein [Pseudotabrizicola sp.]MDZ7575254.1 lysophospholipid acyltransferase family protein [Pseudotabrizicola sp.]
MSALAWLRFGLRAGILGVVTYGGLVLLLVVRGIEWPVFGMNRPWTPRITQTVCRMAMAIMGIGLTVRGVPMRQRGAMVANHASWLDIFALNACAPMYFVAKSEVSGWAGIGWLARATGTVFIARKGTEAKRQQQMFEDRLRAGHRLMFFPEGTSTDSRRVLPFKSTLFAAFFTHGLEAVMHIQPVTVIYRAPEGADPRFYGWWGDMTFAGHLVAVLSARRRGAVEVIFHPDVPVDAFTNRKDLSTYCERVIATAHPDLERATDP